MQETLKTTFAGHVLITDNRDHTVLVDEYNAIHPQNMATAIARGLANSANSQIFKLKLGNGGTNIDAAFQIVFNPPNVTGETADLYNPTWVEIVDEDSAGFGVGNSVQAAPISGSTEHRVIITCIIGAGETPGNPTDGGDGDSSLDPESEYFFDELGLFTNGGGSVPLNDPNELMLSHLIFSPIEHTGNREITIVYTLTISVS